MSRYLVSGCWKNSTGMDIESALVRSNKAQRLDHLCDAFSAGFTTIKSMCESHMTASATACRQFNAGTMFHPALAKTSPNQKINPKSSSTIKAVGLHFATGCVEGVSGDFYGDGVVYNPNDLSIHQQFQRD